MQIDGATSNLDINTMIDDLCDSNDTSYPVAKKLLYVNAGLERVVGTILTADGIWQWDDTAYTDFPIAHRDLVGGQQDYAFDDGFLKIEKVSVMDANGIYQPLQPIDIKEMGDEGVDPTQFAPSNGMPQYYDKLGRSVFLYPAPASGSVTLVAGLKVYYQRTASLFTTSDTTKVPGFASPYHSILAYMAAIPYCIKYKPDRVVAYRNEVEQQLAGIVEFYTKANKDDVAIIKNKPIIFR